jgi:non-homologous end joining protein Ku
VENDDGKVIDLMDALQRSLAGGGASKKLARRYLERKATVKAKPRVKSRRTA